MKWIIAPDRFVYDTQTGEFQCLLPKSEDELRDKMIEVSPEIFNAILSFIRNMDHGKNTTRSTYNEFKKILKRVPKELLNDERLISVR